VCCEFSFGGSTRHGLLQRGAGSRSRFSTHIAQQRLRGDRCHHVLDRTDPGQMIQVYSEDPSNVKSYRTGLRHLTRAEADIEFALDASGYGQDATTGWAMAKSQHGIDLAVVTQPEDFPKQPWQAWQRRIAYQSGHKPRARCRHFRFASRSLDDWRRLGCPASAVTRTAVLHLHLETSSGRGSQPLSRLCIRAFCGLNNVPTQWGRRGKCGTPQRSGVGERGERMGWTRGSAWGRKKRPRSESETNIPNGTASG
jgi:hypothetical protein